MYRLGYTIMYLGVYNVLPRNMNSLTNFNPGYSLGGDIIWDATQELTPPREYR